MVKKLTSTMLELTFSPSGEIGNKVKNCRFFPFKKFSLSRYFAENAMFLISLIGAYFPCTCVYPIIPKYSKMSRVSNVSDKMWRLIIEQIDFIWKSHVSDTPMA